MAPPRTSRTLADRPEYHVAAVTCRDDHARWSGAEVRGDYRLVLVRRGRFRRRVPGPGGIAQLDATVGYLGLPGEEESFAHPAGGDVCTAVTLGPPLWRALAGEAPPAAGALYVDARLELAHRRLLAAARSGEVAYAVTEELLALLVEAVRRTVPGRTPLDDGTAERERRLVDAARQAIADGHPGASGLLPLAELLGVSPYRLSRAFPRVLGVPLTRYRNRVRVGVALARLEAGETALASLAAELGFADQPHLTRTLRAHLGSTPAALRRLLAPAN